MSVNPNVITKLQELRALVDDQSPNLSFYLNDDDSATTYGQNVSDSDGNSTTISRRIAKPKPAQPAQANQATLPAQANQAAKPATPANQSAK
jgi:hypothetical protein